MRFYALGISAVVCLQLLSGCLIENDSIYSDLEEVFPDTGDGLDIQNRRSIIGDISNQTLTIEQVEKFNSVIELNRQNPLDTGDIPNVGGNWTHYFVCSNGEKIDYVFPMPSTFSCDGTDEVLSGEQYETSWIAYRHREVIREYALNSAISFFLTNITSDGELARDVLLHYAKIYDALPMQDKHGNEGHSGGKLTRQSLDEAVHLIDLAWIHYLLQPMLTPEENMSITSGLIFPMVETLKATGNQQQDALSNWYAYHNAAMGMAAVSTNNHTLLEESLNQWNGLYHQLHKGFDENGFWHEGSIAYQNYTLTAMAINIEAARHFGVALDHHSWPTAANFSLAIHDLFVAHLSLVKPDGTFPKLNDDILGTNLASIINLLEFTNRHWPGEVPSTILRQARNMSDGLTLRSSLWFSPINEASSELTSLNYESFGISVLRHNDMYVLLDYGPHGGWHGHFDKLGVEVSAGESNLISDPGTVPYSLPSSRDWYRTSFAHSLPFVGYENQPEATGCLLNHNFANHSSFIMAQYFDENHGMQVSRLLLVITTHQYGDVLVDMSHWSGEKSQIATQTYHFSNASHSFVGNKSGNDSSPFNLDPHAQLDLLDDRETVNFTAGDDWHAYLHVSEENKLYGGTSINGGAFFIQANEAPSPTSTMLSVYTHGDSEQAFNFYYTSTTTSSSVQISKQTIVVDWTHHSVTVEEAE